MKIFLARLYLLRRVTTHLFDLFHPVFSQHHDAFQDFALSINVDSEQRSLYPLLRLTFYPY